MPYADSNKTASTMAIRIATELTERANRLQTTTTSK